MVMTTVLRKLLPFAFSSRSKHPVEDEARKMAIISRSKYKKPHKKIKGKKDSNKRKDTVPVAIVVEDNDNEPKVPIDYKAPNNDPLYINAIDEAIQYKLIYLGERPDISTISTIGKILTQYQKSNNPYRQHYDSSLHIVRNPSTDSDNSNNEVIDKENELHKDISNGVSISNVKERKRIKRINVKNRNTMIEPLLHNKNLDINNEQDETINFITKRSTNSNISSDNKHITKNKIQNRKKKSKSSRLDKYKINRMITQTNTESIMKGMYIKIDFFFFTNYMSFLISLQTGNIKTR